MCQEGGGRGIWLRWGKDYAEWFVNGQSSGIKVKQDTWHCVAVVYNSFNHTARLYVDDEVLEFSYEDRIGTRGSLYIGGTETSDTGLHAVLNHVFVYNVALSDGDMDWIRANQLTWSGPVASTAGYAVYFDPLKSQRIDISTSELNLEDKIAFTVGLWISVASQPLLTDYYIVDKSDDFKIRLHYDTVNKETRARIDIGNHKDPSSGMVWSVPGRSIPHDGAWVHLALTWGSQKFTFYVNGESQVSRWRDKNQQS